MRIGLVSYEYPPQQGLGGVGTYMFRLAGALGHAGHDIHVIAGPSDRAPVEQTNVTLHRIPADFQLETPNRALRFLYWKGIARTMAWMHPVIWHWIKWDLASYRAIEEVDAKFPLDLIEAPEHAANGWMAGKIHRWPIVLRMHCPWEMFVRINRFPFNPANNILARLERHTVHKYADVVTVPSVAMKSELDRSWRPRRPALVIPNFMDVPAEAASLPSESGPQQIVSIGRIEPLKGQDTLCRAFAKIASRHPNARLMLVGPDRWPGQKRFGDLLPELVPDPLIRARIELPGSVPLETVNRLLRESRIAVVGSIGFESFSFSALEALAAARPVVASNVGALPELIRDEETGLIVPPADAHAMADALDRLLDDRALCERLGSAAHARARTTYDTQCVLPQMLDAYEQASSVFHSP